MKRPNLYDYKNYRVFLKDSYQAHKEEDPKFSFRYFSRMGGFKSPNFFKLVMEGKRSLSSESIEGFAKALKLNAAERKYFRALVLENQAVSDEEKRLFQVQRLRLRLSKNTSPIDKAKFAYYSQWYSVVIREIASLKEGLKADPQAISQLVYPALKPEEAKQALQVLESLGLITIMADKRIRVTDSFISTGAEVDSSLIKYFHHEMIRKGAATLDSLGGTEREVSSVTLGLSSDGMGKLRERLQEWRQEALAIAAEDAKADKVFQLNFQFFPVSKNLSEDQGG